MPNKRLSIELSTDQYELLHKQAKASGTTVTGMIRRLIDEFRFRVPERARKEYQTGPIYQRRGSFNGPQNLAEDHDHYIWTGLPMIFGDTSAFLVIEKCRDAHHSQALTFRDSWLKKGQALITSNTFALMERLSIPAAFPFDSKFREYGHFQVSP